jgi:hypothetical protein
MTTAILCAAGTIERLRRPQPWRMRRDQVRHRLHALGRAAQPAELAPVVQGMAADVVPRIAELDRGPRAQPGRAVGLGPLIGVGTSAADTELFGSHAAETEFGRPTQRTTTHDPS